MPSQIHRDTPKPFGKFLGIRVGDAIGFVDGPGVFPTDQIGVVLGFGEDRWGEYVVVRKPYGSCDDDRVQSFTEVGIGVYHLPTFLMKNKEAAA